jgi:hypothetical protein
MMTFFPTPYPDEILYSVFARYHVKSPNFNGSETARDLFNVKRIVCSLEFPTLLANLVRNMPLNSPFDVDRLIFEHTLFPYYTVFLSLENREIIRQYMWHGDVEIYTYSRQVTPNKAAQALAIASFLSSKTYKIFCTKRRKTPLKNLIG